MRQQGGKVQVQWNAREYDPSVADEAAWGDAWVAAGGLADYDEGVADGGIVEYSGLGSNQTKNPRLQKCKNDKMPKKILPEHPGF